MEFCRVIRCFNVVKIAILIYKRFSLELDVIIFHNFNNIFWLFVGIFGLTKILFHDFLINKY